LPAILLQPSMPGVVVMQHARGRGVSTA
jgi:hypothetical protein